MCFSSGCNKGHLEPECRLPTHLAQDSPDMASGSLCPENAISVQLTRSITWVAVLLKTPLSAWLWEKHDQ